MTLQVLGAPSRMGLWPQPSTPCRFHPQECYPILVTGTLRGFSQRSQLYSSFLLSNRKDVHLRTCCTVNEGEARQWVQSPVPSLLPLPIAATIPRSWLIFPCGKGSVWHKPAGSTCSTAQPALTHPYSNNTNHLHKLNIEILFNRMLESDQHNNICPCPCMVLSNLIL